MGLDCHGVYAFNKGELEESYLAGTKVGRASRIDGKEEGGSCVGTYFTEIFRIEAWEPRASLSLTSHHPWRVARVSWKLCTLPPIEFSSLSAGQAVWEHCPSVQKAGPLTLMGSGGVGKKPLQHGGDATLAVT